MMHPAGWTGRVRKRWWGGHEAERDVGFGQLKWVPLEEHHLEKIFKEIHNLESEAVVLRMNAETLRGLLNQKAYGRPGPGSQRDPASVSKPEGLSSSSAVRSSDNTDSALTNVLLTTAIVNTETSTRCDPPSSSGSSYSSDSSSSSSDSGSSCSSSD